MEKIKFKRTSTAGNVPTVAQCDKGELVINSTDRKLFTQDENGNVVELGSSLAERYAMPKVQFDANREANKEKFAGSGIVEWGGSYHDNLSTRINKGMYTRENVSNSLRLGRKGDVLEKSKVDNPLFCVDGVILNLKYTAYINDLTNKIHFPPCPDGTKSYDSATGVVTDHLTYLDPKYNNTAALSQSDAVSRCFEGLVKNGDFRLGTEGWYSQLYSSIVVNDGVATINTTEAASRFVYTDILSNAGGNFTLEIMYSCPTGQSIEHRTDSATTGVFLPSTDDHIKTITFNIQTPSNKNVVSSFACNTIQNGTAPFKIYSVSLRPVTSAPILTRQDFVFLESWHEVIGTGKGEKNIIVPLGNSQYGATTWNGIPLKKLTDLGVGQGYCAFGEWDADTVGYGVLISELTDAQLKKFLQDPKNNIYFDAETGKLIQVRYRIRVVEGCNDDISLIAANKANTYLGLNAQKSIRPQGGVSDSNDFDISKVNAYFSTKGTAWDNHLTDDEITIYHATSGYQGVNFTGAYQGKCFAMPICLRQTLNQGAYHPEFNPSGCALWGSNTNEGWAFFWHSTNTGNNKPKNSTLDCFLGVTKNNNGTGIGGIGSGRPSSFPDQFYDAVYAHQIFDLRLSAHKQDVNKLRVDAMRKAVAGEMRGWGKVPFTVKKNVSPSGSSSAMYIFTNSPTPIAPDVGSVFNGTDEVGDIAYIKILDIGNTVLHADYATFVDGNWHECVCYQHSEYTALRGKDTTITTWITSGSMATLKIDIMWFGNTEKKRNGAYALTPQNDTLAWTDLVGSPENISKCFPNGVQGMWIPVIPDGVTSNYTFNRKVNATTISRVFTKNNGESWSSSGFSVDPIKNSGFTTPEVSHVHLYNYPTPSNFTEPADNAKVVGEVGDVQYSSAYFNNRGNRLHGSLTGGVGTDNTAKYITKSTIKSAFTLDDGKFSDSSDNYPIHNDLDINTPINNSPAVKTLSTITEKDGLLYMQYHGRELHYDAIAGNWGDNSTIPVIEGEGTMTDDNGHTVKTFCHHGMIPLGIASHSDSSQSS